MMTVSVVIGASAPLLGAVWLKGRLSWICGGGGAL